MTQEHLGDLELEVRDSLELSEPPKYKVLLFNDDYTPMEFVVDILQRFFGMHHEAAVQVMLAVHQRSWRRLTRRIRPQLRSRRLM